MRHFHAKHMENHQPEKDYLFLCGRKMDDFCVFISSPQFQIILKTSLFFKPMIYPLRFIPLWFIDLNLGPYGSLVTRHGALGYPHGASSAAAYCRFSSSQSQSRGCSGTLRPFRPFRPFRQRNEKVTKIGHVWNVPGKTLEVSYSFIGKSI